MDQPIVILLYALLVAIIVLYFVGRVLKKKARNAGSARAEAKKDRQASDGLGVTVTVDADVDTVRELVSPIFESTKRVRLRADGAWAHTHYNDDDVVYQLTPTPGGTLIAVSRAIEFAGTLNGMKAWAKLRHQIAAAAAERGIAVVERTRPLARSGETGPTGAVMWRARD